MYLHKAISNVTICCWVTAMLDCKKETATKWRVFSFLKLQEKNYWFIAQCTVTSNRDNALRTITSNRDNALRTVTSNRDSA